MSAGPTVLLYNYQLAYKHANWIPSPFKPTNRSWEEWGLIWVSSSFTYWN